jgi:hypothetical protein
MNNVKKDILKKCGWSEEQTNFLGTMVYDLEKEDGTSIMNIISHHMEKEVIVEWFVPNKQIGERISFSYLPEQDILNRSKTSHDIQNLDDMNKVLEIISFNIKNEKGLFMPTKKIESPKNELKI